MAKKKEAPVAVQNHEDESLTLAEKLARLNKVTEGISKNAKIAVKVGFASSPAMQKQLKVEYIKTPSMEFNAAFGGFPRKKWTLIAGKPDSGKTNLLLNTIGENMQEDPGFVAAWIETENSLVEDMFDVFGIDPKRFLIIYPDRVGGGEAALDVLETYFSTGAIDIVCINSLKLLVPQEELKAKMSDAKMCLSARMNSRLVAKFNTMISNNNAAFIIVAHLTTSIGSRSNDPLIIGGGFAIQFISGLTLDMRKYSIGEDDLISREEGVKICVSCRKNHLTARKNPYVKIEYYARFGIGIEKVLPTLELAKEKGIITVNGSWLRQFTDDGSSYVQWNGTDINFQGKAAFSAFCRDNPDYFKQLQSMVSGDFVPQEMDAEEVALVISENEMIEEMAKEYEKESKAS